MGKFIFSINHNEWEEIPDFKYRGGNADTSDFGPKLVEFCDHDMPITCTVYADFIHYSEPTEDTVYRRKSAKDITGNDWLYQTICNHIVDRHHSDPVFYYRLKRIIEDVFTKHMHEFEPTEPLVEVWTFKESGKYYSSQTVPLKQEHYKLAEYGLMELFRNNDPGVACYSPVTSRFGSTEFSHFIHVHYPRDFKGFCTLLLTPTNQADWLSKAPLREKR